MPVLRRVAPDPAPGATVAAVLHPRERAKVEAAGTGAFTLVHGDSVADAMRLVRERPVQAVLLSVHAVDGARSDGVATLMRRFPSVPTVALVSEHTEAGAEALLRLGATGVRQVVDVTRPLGWRQLRGLVDHPASRATSAIQHAVFTALPVLPPDARLFLEAMIRHAPDHCTVRDLCARLGLRSTTLVSRFARHGLPSPKHHLSALRLVHAAFLFQDRGLSVADVAYRMQYSSPQSFARHVRHFLGVSTTEFRRRHDFASVLERFIAQLVRPYAGRWERLRPLRQRAA
ncbi:MAG: helix-turn-helix transcriptional regulator [Gemmatimonadales bacterium]|nr:helix-turn-helix transcriptional regulator [Gemmatimonadales bacterium]